MGSGNEWARVGSSGIGSSGVTIWAVGFGSGKPKQPLTLRVPEIYLFSRAHSTRAHPSLPGGHSHPGPAKNHREPANAIAFLQEAQDKGAMKSGKQLVIKRKAAGPELILAKAHTTGSKV